MKTKGETFIPEDFELTPATLAWLDKNHPQVDPEATLTKFRREAEAKGWMYRSWQRAFEGVVDKGMANGWRSIVTFREGRKADPMWQTVVTEAKKYGFRDPDRMETPNSYRTAFNNWKGDPRNRPGLRVVS